MTEYKHKCKCCCVACENRCPCDAPCDLRSAHRGVASGASGYNQIDKQDGVATRSSLAKIRLDLLPVGPLIEVGKVFSFGAAHYGDRNWEYGFAWSRCYGALLRHLWKWFLGEDCDDESGCNHLAHVIANALFLLEYSRTHTEFDDRQKSSEQTIHSLFKSIATEHPKKEL